MSDDNECRAYATHLLSEHRRLHEKLRGVRLAITSSGGRGGKLPFPDVVQVLQQVREELQGHFAEEEAGGCLDEAVARLPRLSAEARRIEAEHPELLRQLDLLIEIASDHKRVSIDRLAFDKQFDELYRRLHAHEAAENNLLRQGFGVTIYGEEAGEL